ncbi:MAG: aromatic ring-hydroxylating dioxygenase subunit alpha [Rhodospirillales bacterium]|nr:aromatic ring-hydroxylating dioxygenase subunit alpha [Rhodospirillales bacterium]
MNDTAFEPFLRNAWYLGAWSEELSDGHLGRTIMNEPIVFFRGPDGKAAALEDRCCHRGAPLTHGQVVEAGIECGYHGLIFNGSGACVDIPGHDNIPPQTKVRSYPVVERQEFVWIWMGEAARADESKIIDFQFHDQPDKWPNKKGMIPIKSNYMMMIDNLMDLTHLGYVHAKTIGGNPRAHAKAEFDAMPTENGARFDRWMMDAAPPPTYKKAVGFEGNVDRWWDFEYVAPSSVLQWNGAIDVGKNARENQDQPGFHLRLFHSATPETEGSFHYFFSAANGYQQDDPEATEVLFGEIFPTFIEDKEIMEVQQARLELDPGRKLVAIPSDKALTHARQTIRRLVAEERAEMAQAAE